MKPTFKYIFVAAVFIAGCNSTPESESTDAPIESENVVSGQSAVKDDVSSPNIVQVAVGSKDHTTLVAALKAAELVDALSNAGPFTVFAPTNAAFDKLPAGTLEGLLKPEKKETLIDILQYHVAVGVYKAESFIDGQSLGEVNGSNIKISIVDGKPVINGKTHIIASIPTSNGIIHVIDEVLLPPAQ
ncbi:fasciclin domain-containing protein [soil metagenome]